MKAVKGNHLFPPHRREYEDCKQILKLSLNPSHTLKRPARLQPDKPSEDLPYGQSGIRRLSACIRYTPAFCQSSSIDNSLRSIKKIWSGDFRLFPPANFANSAILPTDKISAFFMQNFLLQKPKDSSLLCPKPHRGYERQRAGRTSPEGQCVPAEK